MGLPSLTSLLGGVAFGVGMVLAGGCVVGSLYRMGAGSLLSGSAFLGLLAGSALYPELHPVWQRVANATTPFPHAITLPQLLEIDPGGPNALVALIGGFFLYRWSRRDLWRREAVADGYLQPWKAALLLAAVGLFSYLVVGMPLGVTTSYTKLGTALEAWVLPEHVAGLAYLQAQPLVYVPPFGDAAIRGGAGPGWDAVAAVQYPLILGILAGSALSALLLRELRLYWRVPPRQYAAAFAGGAIMGLGARMTPGCNVWHLWGGLPILALQSLLFLAGMTAGSWAGVRLLLRLVLRDGPPATSARN